MPACPACCTVRGQSRCLFILAAGVHCAVCAEMRRRRRRRRLMKTDDFFFFKCCYILSLFWQILNLWILINRAVIIIRVLAARKPASQPPPAISNEHPNKYLTMYQPKLQHPSCHLARLARLRCTSHDRPLSRALPAPPPHAPLLPPTLCSSWAATLGSPAAGRVSPAPVAHVTNS